MTTDAEIPQTRTRRPILRLFAFPIILFLLGGAAIAWLLTHTQAGREFLAPQTAPVTVKPPPPVALIPPAVPPATPPLDMAGRLASLEARIAQIEARGPGASGSSRADAMFTLFAARRAIEHGLALGGIETELTTQFGTAHPRATAAVLASARQPVSLAKLTQQLRDLAPALAGAPPADDWWGKLTHGLSNLIVVRDAATPGGDPQLRLDEAQKLLATGQVEAAISQISVLPERARATEWMSAARRYAEALTALDELDEAILAPVAPPPVTPANTL